MHACVCICRYVECGCLYVCMYVCMCASEIDECSHSIHFTTVSDTIIMDLSDWYEREENSRCGWLTDSHEFAETLSCLLCLLCCVLVGT